MRKSRLWLKAVLKAGGVFPEPAVDQAQNAVVCWARVRLILGHFLLFLLPWCASAALALDERRWPQRPACHEEKDMKLIKHRGFLFSLFECSRNPRQPWSQVVLRAAQSLWYSHPYTLPSQRWVLPTLNRGVILTLFPV